MAHLRRRYEDAYKCGSEQEAGIALKYIQEIYNIERILREKKLEKEDFIRQRKERVMPVCIGRRNWLFFGNEKGARSSCLMYTLIENARISGLNPEKYLEYLFNRAPYCITEDDWKQVLPWNVKLV